MEKGSFLQWQVLDAPAIQKAFALKENPPTPKNTKNHVTTEPWKITEDKNGYYYCQNYCASQAIYE